MMPVRDFAPVSPGSFLRDQVLRRKDAWITQDNLADALGVSRHSVNQLVNERRSMTAEMAVRLAHVLGTSPEFWMQMQVRRDIFAAQRKLADELSQMPRLREVEAAPPE